MLQLASREELHVGAAARAQRHQRRRAPLRVRSSRQRPRAAISSISSCAPCERRARVHVSNAKRSASGSTAIRRPTSRRTRRTRASPSRSRDGRRRMLSVSASSCTRAISGVARSCQWRSIDTPRATPYRHDGVQRLAASSEPDRHRAGRRCAFAAWCRASAFARRCTASPPRSALGGSVRNDAEGVWIELEGDAAARRALRRAPARSSARRARASTRIESHALPDGDDACDDRVHIVPSTAAGLARALRAGRRGAVRRLSARARRSARPPPPLSVHQLHRLRAALHDRARRSRTIARATTMAPFALCDGCRARVRGSARPPLSRRAERVPARAGRSCALVDGDGVASRATRRSRRRSRRLAAGAIVAVKGVGGFLLAVDARNEAAVARAARAQASPAQAVRA